MRRCEKGMHYYQAIVHQDLLGDWVVLKMRGSKLSKLGAHAVERVGSQDEGRARVEQINLVRRKRGYVSMKFFGVCRGGLRATLAFLQKHLNGRIV